MHPGSRCTVEQGSASGRCFSLVSLAWHYPQPLVFLPSVEKEVDTKRKVISFIRLEGPDAINTGRVEWWAAAKAVQRLWYCKRKQKKGKSSYCDPVREQQPFWLLFILRGFSTCFVVFTGLNASWLIFFFLRCLNLKLLHKFVHVIARNSFQNLLSHTWIFGSRVASLHLRRGYSLSSAPSAPVTPTNPWLMVMRRNVILFRCVVILFH